MKDLLHIIPFRKNFKIEKLYPTRLSIINDILHKKIGDGTLISSICDCNKGLVNLYFNHDYKTTVQFNLSEEFKKGDRIIAIETLFPENPEFEKLPNF